MHIRAATAADLPAIVALLADDDLGAARESPVEDDGHLDGAYAAAFAAIQADPRNEVLVGVEDGDVVATLQLVLIPHLTFRGGWRAQIEALRVAGHRRDGGLGRRLLAFAVARARDAGCHLVQLSANAERADARRFYESMGFTATHAGYKHYLTGDVTGR